MRCKNPLPFIISRLQLVQNPISLLLNYSHDFEALRNGLLSHCQWFCQFFLRLVRVFSKKCLRFRIFEIFLFPTALPVLDLKITALEALKPLTTRSFTKSSLTVSTWEHSMSLSRSFPSGPVWENGHRILWLERCQRSRQKVRSFLSGDFWFF